MVHMLGHGLKAVKSRSRLTMRHYAQHRWLPLIQRVLSVAALLHDPVLRESLRARVQGLRPDATRKWGKMTIDQMLWHVSQALAQGIGQIPAAPVKMPLPKPMMKFVVLNLPWPKGSPTAPEFVADMQRCEFEAERNRCLNLIDAFAAKDMKESWPVAGTLGTMSGRDWSRLEAKHLDHHLKQFSA